MSKFIQLHLLTSYPPANLNRDDLGRPKTAMMGGSNRLRISSQSLKRAWRTSEVFRGALSDHIGTRTKGMGREIYTKLLEKGVKGKAAFDYAQAIAKVFGKLKTLSKKEKDDADEIKLLTELDIEQLAHFSPEEKQAIDQLISELASNDEAPTDEQLALLRKQHTAADIALFGRMLASRPAYNTEAAAQVAHAISVHKVTIEDDFFTAVDDLNSGEEDMGAGHMGETEFAAGLFYLYICIDRDLLLENLSGDAGLTDKTLAAFIEAAATVAPSGKQNSFASRARASYILCERGDQQPRSLSVAFLKSISGGNVLDQAIHSMNKTVENMDKVYGACANDDRHSLNAETGEGSLQSIIDYANGN